MTRSPGKGHAIGGHSNHSGAPLPLDCSAYWIVAVPPATQFHDPPPVQMVLVATSAMVKPPRHGARRR